MTTDEKARRFERALALAGNTHTATDVLDKVRSGRAQCWPNGDSVIITEINVYPRVRACNYWILSGTLDECAALQPTIDEWAIEEGCGIATGTGRMGWLRAMAQRPFGAGWKPRGVQFVKPLGSAQ